MKKIIYIIFLLFLINDKLDSQTVEIIFPQVGSTDISIDAKIKIQTNEPFIFDTTSLPFKDLHDSLLIGRGLFGAFDMSYYCESDSCKAFYMSMSLLSFVDSVSPDMRTIWLKNEQSFEYQTHYGLWCSNIKVVNINTNDVFEIDTLVPNLFITIQKPLKFTGASFQDIPLTCKDNSFLVNFNVPLTTYTGENGNIVTVDSVQFERDSIPYFNKPVMYPMNMSLQLTNNNTSLIVTLDSNFNDGKIYYLNVLLSRITGNIADDISFSFQSRSITRVNVHSDPTIDPNPTYDSLYFVKPGDKLNIWTKPYNSDYVFDRWECPDCPPMLYNYNDSLPNIEIEFTCDNIIPVINLYPVYKRLPLDTCIFVLPRDYTGNVLGGIQVTGAIDSLNDSSFVFKEGTNFSFCYNSVDSIGFSHWELNNQSSGIESRCVVNAPMSKLTVNNGIGVFVWEPIPIIAATPCSDVVVNVKLKYIDDDAPPNNSTSTIKQIMKVVYQDIEYPLSFSTSPSNPKIANAQLILPAGENQNLTIYFEDPIPILQGYEFYQMTYDKGPNYNLGSSSYGLSIQRIISEFPSQDRYWTIDLAKGFDNDCDHNIEITLRKKRQYIKVTKVMRYDEKLSNETVLDVQYYKPQNNEDILLSNLNDKNGLYEFINERAYVKNEKNETIKSVRYFEVPKGFIIKFAPYIQNGSGFEYYQWEPSNYIEKFIDSPIINNPLPNTLGSIQVDEDISVKAVFQSGFRIEKIGYKLEDGSWYYFSADQLFSIDPTNINKNILMGLNDLIGYTPNPSYPDGIGTRTGTVRFIFNREIDLNKLQDGAIEWNEKSLVNGKRLDGETSNNYFSKLYINTIPFTMDGEVKVLDMKLFNLKDNIYNLGLTPMSKIYLTVHKEKIYSIQNSQLQNSPMIQLATRYPEIKFKLDQVISYGSHDGWFAPKDEVYGYFWLGHRNTTPDGNPFSASDINQKGLKIPENGEFENDQFFNISENIYVNDIGQYSYIGLSWRFYDKDCGSFYLENQAQLDELFNKIKELAKNDLAKLWDPLKYLGTAVDIFKTACLLDKDDFLGSQGLVFQYNDFWKGNDNNDLRDNDYSPINNSTYIFYPMYLNHFYKQRQGSIEFYFQKILY